MRAWIGELAEDPVTPDERDRCRKRPITDSDALAARQRALMGQIEELLAEALTFRRGGLQALRNR
jgi:hypothetical protein